MSVISPFVAAFERYCAGNRALFHLYSLPYRALVARELSLAGTLPTHTIMHVGCGSLPFTAVLAARLSGAKVIGVDCDPDAVRNAQRIVGRLGLSGSGPGTIDIIHADAACDLLPDAGVILVALQAGPKDAIYENIARSMDTAHAIFRLPRAGLEGEYGTLHAPRIADGVCRHAMPTFDRSVLYSLQPGYAPVRTARGRVA